MNNPFRGVWQQVRTNLNPSLAESIRREAEIQARKNRLIERVASSIGVKTISESVTGGVLLDDDSGPMFDLIAYMTDDAITEADYWEMQRRMYKLVTQHPLASGWVNLAVEHIVGDEFQMLSCDHDPKTQEVWDKQAENMAGKDATQKYAFPKFAQDITWNGLTFGEDLQRVFSNEVDGSLAFRMMNPVWIRNPGGGLSNWKHSWTPLINATFGIQTDPDDILNVMFYWYDQNRNGDYRKVPGEDVIHTKIGSRYLKRGRPWLLPVIKTLIQLDKLLTARTLQQLLRCEVAYWDRVPEGIDPEVAKAILKDNQGNADGINANRQLDNHAGSTGIINGLERVYATPNLQAADAYHDIRTQFLICGRALRLTEHSVSGDASNADMASIRETSFGEMLSFRTWQKFFGQGTFEPIGTRTIESAIDAGVLSAESYEEFEEVSKADPGIISKGKKTVPRNTKFKCQYPELNVRDFKAQTDALLAQLAQKIIDKREVRVQLGYNADDMDHRVELEAARNPDPMDAMGTVAGMLNPTGGREGNGPRPGSPYASHYNVAGKSNGNGKEPHVVGKNGRSDSKAVYRHSGTES